jgi:hypothetical protein
MVFRLKHTDELREKRALGRTLIALGKMLVVVALLSCFSASADMMLWGVMLGGAAIGLGKLLDWIYNV